MALWMFSTCSNPPDEDTVMREAAEACADSESAGEALGCGIGYGIGAALAPVFIFILWLVGFIVLSLVWLMSKPRDWG